MKQRKLSPIFVREIIISFNILSSSFAFVTDKKYFVIYINITLFQCNTIDFLRTKYTATHYTIRPNCIMYVLCRWYRACDGPPLNWDLCVMHVVKPIEPLCCKRTSIFQFFYSYVVTCITSYYLSVKLWDCLYSEQIR